MPFGFGSFAQSVRCEDNRARSTAGLPSLVPGFGWQDGRYAPVDYVATAWERPSPGVVTRADAATERKRCADDLCYFALTHGWTVHVDDPSHPVPRKLPAYPYVIELLRDLQAVDNWHIDKSRQMMLTWIVMIVFVWDVLFHNNWTNLAVSYREAEVDQPGHPYNTLLGKVYHVWSCLPPYLREPLVFTQGLVRNPTRNSAIRGLTANSDNVGHGQGVNRALLDEAARIDRGEVVFTGLALACKRGLILMSTPNGATNMFARIRFDPHTPFRKRSVHWLEDPIKAADASCSCGWRVDGVDDRSARAQFLAHRCPNGGLVPPRRSEAHSSWYDAQARKMTPAQVASQLEISYDHSQPGRVFAAFDHSRHVVGVERWCVPRRDGESVAAFRARYLGAVLEPHKPCVVGWDFGVNEPTSLVLGQVLDDELMRIRWIDEFEWTNQSWEFYYRFVQDCWQKTCRDVTHLDLLHYGDPAGASRASDLSSWITNLRSRIPPIVVSHGPSVGSKLAWLDFLHVLIQQDRIEIVSVCAGLIDALNSYHFPVDRDGQPIPGRHEPVHDRHSHVIDAWRYTYQFRYRARLTNVDKTIVGDREILAAMAPDPASSVECPVDSAGPGPRPRLPRMNYF